MKFLRIYWLFALISFFSANLYSSVFPLVQSAEPTSLDAYIEIFDSNYPINSIESLLKAENSKIPRFPYYDIKTKLLPDKYYWAKIELENNTPLAKSISEWVISFSLIPTDMDAFLISENQSIQRFKTGFFIPAAERSFAPALKANLLKIPIEPNEKVSLYLKFISERHFLKPALEMEISPVQVFYAQQSSKDKWNNLYYGLLFMMLLYNIILFFFIRDKSYLFYAFWLLAIGIFMTYNSGALVSNLIPNYFPDSPKHIYFFKTVVYFSLIAYSRFLISFLEIDQKFPSWNKVFRRLQIAAIPFFFVDIFLAIYTNYSYNIADICVSSYVFIYSIFTTAFCYTLYKKQSSHYLFSILGMMALNLGIFMTLIARLQDIGFTAIFFLLGSFIEIISFSLGMALRQQGLFKEQEEFRFALKESQLIQEQKHSEAIRLKELNRLRTNLYTNITHEFRTPLTAIIGHTEQKISDPKVKDVVLRNSKHLLKLINKILTLSKAESGKLDVKYINSNIVPYIQYLTESFNSLAEEKRIKLVCYAEHDEIIMDFDEDKIHHIIQNLLSNALQFTPENGKVILHLKKSKIQDEENLQIKVKDSGVGISKKDLPFIFDRFYQAKNILGGTGIGLALIKELTHLLDGKINVESEIGSGTEFTLNIPIRNSSKAKPSKEVILETKIPVVKSKNDLIVQDQKKAINHDLDLLIVEDNSDLISYMKLCLENKYNVHIARNGQEGIDIALKSIPDIIISDIMMPVKDGLELCRTLKKDLRTSHIPIILLTAKATQQDKIKGLESGGDAYLSKPFQKEELILRVQNLLKLNQSLQQRFQNFNNLVNESEATSVESKFLQQVIGIIEKHIDDSDFKIDYLARELTLSKTQVYRKIKALTAKTPSQLIREQRMKKALYLLKNTDLLISEIAYNTGHKDPNYFSRVFHEEYGQKPSAMRK